jgi:hypothetical protein
MKSLMWMFSTISLFMLPLLYCYSHNSQKALRTDPLYAITQFSLGNFGGANMQCINKEVLVSRFVLKCDVVRLDMHNIKFGVMSSEIAEPFYCEEEAIWNSADNAGKNFTHCTDHISEAYKKNLTNMCYNKTSCLIDFGEKDLYDSQD